MSQPPPFDPNVLVPALTGLAAALGGLSVVISRVRDEQIKALRETLVDVEQVAERRSARVADLEQQVDNYCQRISKLETAIQEYQGQMTERSVTYTTEAQNQIERLRGLLSNLEQTHQRDVEALAEIRAQVVDLTVEQRRTRVRVDYLLAENQDLKDQLSVLGYPDDPSRTAKTLAALLTQGGTPGAAAPAT